MKKKISLMIAVIILLQIVFPIITIVWESEFTAKSIATESEVIIVGKITWDYTSIQGKNEATVKPKDGSTLIGWIYVPATLDGYSIVGLRDYAFKDYKGITKIILKTDIREIGRHAFRGCSGLLNFEVYDNNEYFSTKDGILFDKKQETLIQFPEGKIKTSYTIPSTVKTIGEYAFYDTRPTSITIPNSVSSITPFGLTSNKLKTITVDSANKSFKSVNGIVFSKDGKEIVCYPAAKTGTSYTVPDTVTTIGMSAFANCSNLKSVNLPETIETIKASGFYGCKNLSKLIVPNGVTGIGQYAFVGCENLKVLSIPDSVTYIASAAFNNCNNLTIYCKSGSYAEKYAKEKNIPYEIIKLSNIEVIESADNTVYIEGEDFDKTGMIVNATYNDGTSKVIENYTIENGTNLQKEDYGVTIKYTEDGVTKTTIQDIMVVEKMVESIEITQAPSKTSYLAGQSFDKTGMKVVATYNDGTSSEITNYTVEDGENLEEGKTSVTVTYMEDSVIVSATQNISVLPNELKQIEITQGASKTEYIEGEKFNADGIVVTATYEDGTTRTIDNYKVIDEDSLTVGKTNVTISYTEGNITKTATHNITVIEKVLTEIEITEKAEKTNYVEGQSFDTDGMKVIAKYNDGSSKEITNYEVTDGNNLAEGKTTVTISYTEEGITKTAIQDITVIQKELREIEIEEESNKKTYVEGQNFNPEGMKVIAVYNDCHQCSVNAFNG